MKKLALAALLYGCAEKVPLNENRVCYPINNDATVFAVEVRKQGIPHVFDEKEKCIFTAFTYYEKIRILDALVFGESPPPGLSTSWVDENPRLIELLESNGIATEKYVNHGIEWIAWSYKDRQAAEDLMKFKPRMRELYKKLRDENSKQPNKVLNSDAQNSRAP